MRSVVVPMPEIAAAGTSIDVVLALTEIALLYGVLNVTASEKMRSMCGGKELTVVLAAGTIVPHVGGVISSVKLNSPAVPGFAT